VHWFGQVFYSNSQTDSFGVMNKTFLKHPYFKSTMKLPEELNDEHATLIEEFSFIKQDWEKYADCIIPEDTDFAIRILQFLINALDVAIEDFDDSQTKDYQDFFGYFYSDFFYGPANNTQNYLDFDSEQITDYAWELLDETKPVTKESLQILQAKYRTALKKISSQKN